MAETKLANVYNSDEELQQQIVEQGGGGGGDVDKAYVDNMDAEERQRAMTKENQLEEKIDNEITRATTEENNIKRDKQDKLNTGSDLLNVSDSTKISYIDLATKIITNFTLATLWNWLTSKLKTIIDNTTTNTDIASGKATKDYVDKHIKYLHTIIRYNSDSKQFPMGWFNIINDKSTMTINDIKQFLKDNNYTTPENSYYWCGGCVGTTGVRNSADTGTAYIGRVASGVFYVESEDSIYFKYDYNGTVTLLYNRMDIITKQI